MQFLSLTGVITEINQFQTGAEGGPNHCLLLYTMKTNDGEFTKFLVAPDTYFIHREVVRKGDQVTCFYDANAPVPLIYPPQYKALVIGKVSNQYFIKVSFFDTNLMSEDRQLQLTVTPNTKIYLENGQPFHGHITNQNLIVLFGPTTRSIPAQTSPYEIILLCE